MVVYVSQQTTKQIKQTTMRTAKTIASILRNASYDCTNNGLSSREVSLAMVNPNKIEGNIQDTLEEIYETYGDFLVVVERKNYSTIVKPYTIYRSGVHSMFGGNFAYTSCSSYYDVTGMNAPIAIHDRVE